MLCDLSPSSSTSHFFCFSFTLLQPTCSSETPRTVPSLCTCYSLCLEYLSPGFLHGAVPHFNISEIFPDHSKIAIPILILYIFLHHGVYHYLIRILNFLLYIPPVKISSPWAGILSFVHCLYPQCQSWCLSHKCHSHNWFLAYKWHIVFVDWVNGSRL